MSKYYFSGKWLATVHHLSQNQYILYKHAIAVWGSLTGFSYSLDRGNKDLTEFFPALTHTTCVEHAQGQICSMGCRRGRSLWLPVLFYYTQKEPSSQDTTTTTLFSTKAEPLVELVWELGKKRLSICILCRLYNLIASPEA